MLCVIMEKGRALATFEVVEHRVFGKETRLKRRLQCIVEVQMVQRRLASV